jgi:hypothetical protein
MNKMQEESEEEEEEEEEFDSEATFDTKPRQ